MIMATRDRLMAVSYLAPNLFWFYEAVAVSLGQALGQEVHLTQAQYDPLDDPMLLEDHLDLAFICGLPFIRHVRQNETLVAIAAPIMQAPRYQACPVYFSDVIVHRDSRFSTFADLAGTTFCYNDLGSNSGYNLVRQRLMQGHHPSNFFGRSIASGSHQQSIRWVLDGIADCAAIDSTVLEQELRNIPEFSNQLRKIESIGPCPMPPVVAAKRLGKSCIHQLQTALLQPSEALRSRMTQANILQYAAVQSSDYLTIAHQYDTALKSGYEKL